jgi:hypothetical protein
MELAHVSQSENDGKFYLDKDRSNGYPNIALARSEAARRQYNGVARSIQIYRNGKLVGLKRY